VKSEQRSNLLQWGAALTIALAIDLPVALNRRHHVSPHWYMHVFAALATIVLLTLIIRGIFFLYGRFSRRDNRMRT
jgi:hypothetical protein